MFVWQYSLNNAYSDKIRDASLAKTVSKCEVNNFTFSVPYFFLVVAFFKIESRSSARKADNIGAWGIYLVNFHQVHDNRFSQDL